MKTPKEQAKATPEEEREQKTIDNLNKSAAMQVQARKDLNKEMENFNNAVLDIVNKAPNEHKGTILAVKSKVDVLLQQLNNGADVEEIRTKLKALK